MFWAKLTSLFAKTPLFGGLVDCTWSDHRETFGQVLLVLVFATAPIWLAALVVAELGPQASPGAFTQGMYAAVANGELFMYSTSLLAPVLWMALSDPKGARVFPSKTMHIVLIVIIDMIASVSFGLITSHSQTNQQLMSRLSAYLFAISVILLYLGTVYHISRLPDVSGELRRQELDFADRFNEHRQ